MPRLNIKNKKKKKKKSLLKDKVQASVLDGMSYELLSLVFFAAAAFFFVLDRFSYKTGYLGMWAHQAVGYLFGYAHVYLIWMYLFLAGAVCLFNRARFRPLLFTLLASFLGQLVFIELRATSLFVSFSKQLLTTQTGWVGAALMSFFYPMFGRVGTYILFFVGQLMACVYLFRFSLSQLLLFIAQSLQVFLQKELQVLWPKLKRLLFFKEAVVAKPRRKLSRVKPVLSDLPVINKAPDTPVSVAESAAFDLPLDDVVEDTVAALDEDVSIDEAKIAMMSTTSGQNDQSDKPFVLPSIELLKKAKRSSEKRQQHKNNQQHAKILEEALNSFNVDAKVLHITSGPSVTRFELQPGEGVKISRITALSKDIALKLAVPDVRIEAPIPGKALVGIEVPNLAVEMVTLRNIVEKPDFYKHSARLLTGIGYKITGDAIEMDLAKMPHVLIAGATGSGKSVCINAIIVSILMRSTPSEVKFLMIDPKKVELSLYEGIPHLLCPVVTDPNKAAATLKKWALFEMERRYDCFSKAGVKDIQGYNNWVKSQQEATPADLPEGVVEEVGAAADEGPLKPLPYIVVVIDELADLMMVASQDVEQTICRLAQMSRATGIHLVIATQRPSVNVITGLIKANVPSRISFFLQSQIDSRTILDMAGAEKLLGRGDMLYSPVGALKCTRAQGVFVSEEEVKGIVAWLKRQGSPDYVNELLSMEPIGSSGDEKAKKGDDVDVLYEDAKQLIMNTRYASTSYLQRKLKVGYNRAARIMDQLEERGVIAEFVGERKVRQGASPKG